MKLRTSSFGSYIRSLRYKEQLPLRKVAAELDIDPSTLGKFEKNTRRPSKKIVKELARIYKVDYQSMLIYALSDKLFEELQDEEIKYEVLKMSEKKLRNHQK